MMLVDETKLTNDVIELIGNGYGMKYDHNNFDKETYIDFVDSIVDFLDWQEENLVDDIINFINKRVEERKP